MLYIENLSCGYTDKNVISDISFSALSGEKICIVGPNGCGKTTLLRAISGLLDYKGKIMLGDTNIKQLSRKEISKKMAMMSQISDIYFSYTVYETVALGRYAHANKKLFAEQDNNDKKVINQCISKVGLNEVKDKPITELSGGQLQRVFLARIFAQEPKIILLDEPTNHLDLKHQIELIEYLKQWASVENRVVVGVMHDLNLAMQLADKIILMDKGKIVFSGSCDEIQNSQKLEEVYKIDIKGFMQKSLAVWK